VASSDVCKDDEWSYLCNTDAWAGAADAVSGGEELQTAALRRALTATTGGAACAATDAACLATKDIVDAKLLNIPKVVNSDRLAQVNKDAGLIHPGAYDMVLTGTPLYSGSTLTVTMTDGDGDQYVDSISLVKLVDASIKNGCDNGDTATSNAGHKDVRSTATVVAADGVCTGQTAKNGQGRKICQAAGGVYVADDAVKFGFAFADLTNFPASASTTKWRLCMVREDELICRVGCLMNVAKHGACARRGRRWGLVVARARTRLRLVQALVPSAGAKKTLYATVVSTSDRVCRRYP
jgi:hypothetical protein